MKLEGPERLLAALLESQESGASSCPLSGFGPDGQTALGVLENRGYPLDRTESSVRLGCAGPHLDPVLLAGLCKTRLGVTLEVWERLVSTNDRARQAADEGAPEGALVLAETQTAGRGRHGHTWYSKPHAGLLMSLLLRPRLVVGTRPSLLPLALGLGVCEGLRDTTGLDIRLRWPNDLDLAGRKLGGLLVEARPGEPGFAICGLGLNVHGTVDPAVPQGTTLGQAGSSWKREVLLAGVLGALEERYEDWRCGRLDRVVDAWLELDLVQGRSVRARTDGKILEGRAVGLTIDGFLEIETPRDGRCALHAGEVQLL